MMCGAAARRELRLYCATVRRCGEEFCSYGFHGRGANSFVLIEADSPCWIHWAFTRRFSFFYRRVVMMKEPYQNNSVDSSFRRTNV